MSSRGRAVPVLSPSCRRRGGVAGPQSAPSAALGILGRAAIFPRLGRSAACDLPWCQVWNVWVCPAIAWSTCLLCLIALIEGRCKYVRFPYHMPRPGLRGRKEYEGVGYAFSFFFFLTTNVDDRASSPLLVSSLHPHGFRVVPGRRPRDIQDKSRKTGGEPWPGGTRGSGDTASVPQLLMLMAMLLPLLSVLFGLFPFRLPHRRSPRNFSVLQCLAATTATRNRPKPLSIKDEPPLEMSLSGSHPSPSRQTPPRTA